MAHLVPPQAGACRLNLPELESKDIRDFSRMSFFVERDGKVPRSAPQWREGVSRLMILEVCLL